MITQTNKRVIADQFYAENLYNKVDLQNLTALPGFENIAIASPLENEVSKKPGFGNDGKPHNFKCNHQ